MQKGPRTAEPLGETYANAWLAQQHAVVGELAA